MNSAQQSNLLAQLENLNAQQLRRLLAEHLSRRKLGLYWESDAIERDRALNANVVLPRLVKELSLFDQDKKANNLIIEGDNFDSLRLLRATHRNKIRVIYIDPPYNTGNKDWVYNDRFVGQNDRWRHSQWLEFLYRRLTLARDLLTPDGVILVSINDENRARLELLMDEVFPGRRLGTVAWRTKDTGNDLSQRFSHVHEHVLIYANPGFKFNGRATDRSKFRNLDNDPRGDWSPQPLTKAHTYIERENTYYPIQDPKTGYWYPCDPNRVWAYASEQVIRRLLQNDENAVQKALSSLRSDTIEELIKKDLIYFPACEPEEVMQFESRVALIAAIKARKGPMLPKKKSPLLREDLPDLDFWIGKPIAPGRPSRKEHWTAKSEGERLAPLSSWVAGRNEKTELDEESDDLFVLRTDRGGVATEEIKSILGSKAFQYPKPHALIKGLLEQATCPGDTVLDFFAGSGTTAQAVLELNAEDGGARRFILCSNTEATPKEPDKNLCRDVCAERVRRVIQGYGKQPSLPGTFAYLQLDLMEAADIEHEATPNHELLMLYLRNQKTLRNEDATKVQCIAAGEGVAVLYCPTVDDAAIEYLASLQAERLAVYSLRPDTTQQELEARGKQVNSYSLFDVLMRGQTTQAKWCGVQND